MLGLRRCISTSFPYRETAGKPIFVCLLKNFCSPSSFFVTIYIIKLDLNWKGLLWGTCGMLLILEFAALWRGILSIRPELLAATVAIFLIAGPVTPSAAQSPYWVRPMQEVHQDFTGQAGTIARFGDSITDSLAFFATLQFPHQNTNADDTEALAWIQLYLPADVWTWQSSPSNGALGGTTSEWPLEPSALPGQRNIDQWLANLNPEMAVILWGTNELHSATPVTEYKARMREITRTVKTNGTIPILTTVPPRHDFTTEATLFADAVRDLALEEQVPLIDYHAEILLRNPGDTWDGVLVYTGGSVFEVQRLISGDGVHPSNPAAFQRDFSSDGLSKKRLQSAKLPYTSRYVRRLQRGNHCTIYRSPRTIRAIARPCSARRDYRLRRSTR